MVVSTIVGPTWKFSPLIFASSGAKERRKKAATDETVPSLLPVALGLRAADDSAGFLGTFGTLKAAWADEVRYPSTLSSSSKLRSAGKKRGRGLAISASLQQAGGGHTKCKSDEVKQICAHVFSSLNEISISC